MDDAPQAPGGISPLHARLARALGSSYRLESALGQGGFGVVFAARDLRLGRDVAVKVLRPELAAPVVRERFRREAEAIASLRHPGVIAIFDIGEREELAWFVMPLVSGRTLRARLEAEGRLPIGEARRVLDGMADALAAAHGRGLVHRDIKPDNILLEGSEQRIVLTDFGIAKSLAASGSGSNLTTDGLVVGTPDYMSPEQAEGGGVVDARSDLFSLGVVGYEALTGQRPYRGPTPAAILLQQLRKPPTPIRELRRECPPELAATVDRCLAVEARERWESAGALLEALRASGTAHQAPAARTGRREGRGEEVRSFRRLCIVVAAVVFGGIVLDLAGTTVLASPPLLLVGAALIAVRYGTLWTRGYGWRELLSGPPDPTRAPEAALTDAAGQARSDRATILRCYGAFPKAEQQVLPDLPARVDELVAICEALAGQTQPAARARLGRTTAALAAIRTTLTNAGPGGLASIAPAIRSQLGPG